MNTFALITDVSLNPQLNQGVGGYLLVPASFLAVPAQRIEKSEVTKRLMVRRFAGSSSACLELQTVLWALEDYRNTLKSSSLGILLIYTDSQCVAGLLKRRTGLGSQQVPFKEFKSPFKKRLSLSQILRIPR